MRVIMFDSALDALRYAQLEIDANMGGAMAGGTFERELRKVRSFYGVAVSATVVHGQQIPAWNADLA